MLYPQNKYGGFDKDKQTFLIELKENYVFHSENQTNRQLKLKKQNLIILDKYNNVFADHRMKLKQRKH